MYLTRSTISGEPGLNSRSSSVKVDGVTASSFEEEDDEGVSNETTDSIRVFCCVLFFRFLTVVGFALRKTSSCSSRYPGHSAPYLIHLWQAGRARSHCRCCQHLRSDPLIARSSLQETIITAARKHRVSGPKELRQLD